MKYADLRKQNEELTEALRRVVDRYDNATFGVGLDPALDEQIEAARDVLVGLDANEKART